MRVDGPQYPANLVAEGRRGLEVGAGPEVGAGLEVGAGPEVADLAGMLSEAPAEVRAAGRSTGDIDWRPVLDWDMLALIRGGDLARARERVQACLSSS